MTNHLDTSTRLPGVNPIQPGPPGVKTILLLAAEDAFECERWRDAGPVTADIDAEIKAAEIVEFDALGIPMPAELDSLRRELEHAPKVREAMRDASLALRRSGRASAASLIALGPQQLVAGAAGGVPWGLLGVGGIATGPELAPRVGRQPRPGPELERERPRGRGRRVGAAAILDDAPVEAELLDGEREDDLDEDFDGDELDEDLDQDEPERAPPPRGARRGADERSPRRRRSAPEQARAARRSDRARDDDWEDDDELGPAVVAVAPSPANDRATWILGGIAGAAVLGMLWFAFRPPPSAQGSSAQAQVQPPTQPATQAPEPVPAAVVEPAPAVDPSLVGPSAAPPVTTSARSPSPRARSGAGSGGTSAPVVTGPSSGGLNPFAGYKTDAVPGQAAGQPPTAQPAASGPDKPASEANPSQPAGAIPSPATEPPTAAPDTPAPAAEPKPAEPKPAEPAPELTKSKMTPAIRSAVVAKVGDLQACYQDAVVGKPDLAGQVVFTISLDQDGVVKKVEISKDEVGYGVAKCSSKKIQRWTLPSAGIPIIFDLPFDFKP